MGGGVDLGVLVGGGILERLKVDFGRMTKLHAIEVEKKLNISESTKTHLKFSIFSNE